MNIKSSKNRWSAKINDLSDEAKCTAELPRNKSIRLFHEWIYIKQILCHNLKIKSHPQLKKPRQEETALLTSWGEFETKIQNCACKKQNTIKSHAMARRQQNQLATTKKQHKFTWKIRLGFARPNKVQRTHQQRTDLHLFVAARKRIQVTPWALWRQCAQTARMPFAPTKSSCKPSSEHCGGKIAPGCPYTAQHTLR